MTSRNRIQVAISSDFLEAFSEIPHSQQSKVRRFIEKFKSDPTASGINYEKINGAADDNLRSVRIDGAYRGIVLKPESGNVYILLWVANHDDAYQWAINRMVRIHPETGAIQVVLAENVAQAETDDRNEQKDTEEPGTDLFAEHRDRELVRLGVPEELMPLIRSISTEEELDRIEPHLPQEAFEALFLLAAGGTIEEVDRELAHVQHQRAEEEVDTADFAVALENPDSQRRFHVVEDELELAEILSAPLEKWRVFLHPSQRRLVGMHANGPVRVVGGAGTGKTVVAMHRAKHLVENVFDRPEHRLLFTTFTVNLAADIRDNLSKICSPEVMGRIDVVNLDRWVDEFLTNQGYEYELDYGRRTGPLWEQACTLIPSDLDVPRSFYREEWEQVIQPKEVDRLEEYLRESRVGRGTRLSRKQRRAIWPVFEEYRALLNEKKLREADDAMRDARVLLEKKGDILPYRSVVVDEGQDFGLQGLKLLRAMVPEQENDLFIVGDAHQRIYRHPVVLSHCGINIRGRGRRLRINYRTTEENRRWAVARLHGVSFDDLDGGIDDQSGYRSLLRGADPEVRSFESFSEEVEYIVAWLQSLSEEEHKQVCLVARTRELLDRYRGALESNDIRTYAISRSEPEEREKPGVRLATMHRVKGLEFGRILIAGANDGVIPLDFVIDNSSSDLEREQAETRERSLLYVAATRARREVRVTSSGKMSRFMVQE